MYEYKVKEIDRVIDGDTVDLIIDLGFDIFVKKRVRLAGINAPETRTRNKEIKKKGLESKEFFKFQIYSRKELILLSKKIGKYGRVIGEIFDEEGKSLNEMMVDGGFAARA